MIHVLQGVDFSRLVEIKYSGGINCQENEVKIIKVTIFLQKITGSNQLFQFYN